MKSRLAIFAALTLLFTSCEGLEDIFHKEKADPVNITVSQSGIIPADGTRVGIYVGAPLAVKNAPGTIQNGCIVPDTPINWGTDQTDSCQISVYAPYNAEIGEATSAAFAIDASSVVATTKAAAKEPETPVTFQNMGSRMVLYLQCTDGAAISSVSFGDIYDHAIVWINKATADAYGEKAAISATKAGESDGVEAWSAIVAPQNINGTLSITTQSGTYSTTYTARMQSGCQYSSEKILTVSPSLPLKPSVMVKTEWADSLAWGLDTDAAPTGSLADIAALATSEDKTDFSFTLAEDAAISYVYSSDYAFFQCENSAIMAEGIKKLSAGTTLSGEISGKVMRDADGNPAIVSLNLDYATVREESSIQAAEATLGAIDSNFDSWLARKVLVKGVKFASALSSKAGTATVTQNKINFSVASVGETVSIANGTYGVLTAFPAYVAGEKSLLIFNSGFFEEMDEPVAPYETSAFTTGCTDLGLYRLSGDAPAAIWTYTAGSDQRSICKGNSSQTWRLQNFAEGRLILATIDVAVPELGTVCNVSFCTLGVSDAPAGSIRMIPVQRADNKLWLRSADAEYGLIISTR